MRPPALDISRVRRLKRAGLLRLCDQVLGDGAPGWKLGKAFEHLVLRAFEVEGAEVVWPYEVARDDGRVLERIDGAVHALGFSCIVESKDWGQNVGIGPIAKLRNQLLRRPASTLSALFSKAGFTLEALELANYLAPQAVLLWGGGEVRQAVSEGGMLGLLAKKYRSQVERGFPYFMPKRED